MCYLLYTIGMKYMKKIKRMWSLFISLAMVLTVFVSVTPVKAYNDVSMSFDIITQVKEYGQDVTHLIIDAKKPVLAASLDVDTFTVNATNYFPTDNRLVYDGNREVTNVYVNDQESIDGKTDSGRYIIVELKSGFTVSGASAISYSGVNYKLNMNYTVIQNKALSYTDGTAASALEFVQKEVKNLGMDDFDLVTYNNQFIRVYAPESDKPLPLVIWNHGAGETYRETNGVNNEGAQLYANMGGVAWLQNQYPCYVVAPQRGTGTNYSRDNVISYINELIAQGKVDGSRIYVTGCSAGGGETYNYIREYPSYFAAAMPICPAGSLSEEDIELIKDIPMWFFHSADDPTIPVANTQKSVAALQAAGASELQYTELENLPYNDNGTEGHYNGHWSWVPLLNNYYSQEYQTNVFDWLFAHKSLPVNTKILANIVDKAHTYKANGVFNNVIESVKVAFADALAKCEAMLTVPAYTLTQEQVNNATKELQTTFEFITYIAVDKTDLTDLIGLVAPDIDNGDIYIESSFKVFEEAYVAAQEVMANNELLEGVDNNIVDKAYSDLFEAWTGLRRIPNKDGLADLIAKANKINTSLYTIDSVASFKNVLNDATAVYNNPEVSQQAVDEAISNLSTAINSLVKITDSSKITSSVSQLQKGDSTVSIKTGDELNYKNYLGLSIIAGASMFILISKKKKEMAQIN